MTHSFRDVTRLVRIKLSGLTFTNRAEPTMARANIAAQHKGCSPVSPALEEVWALRFLTNRVQFQALNQLEQMILVCWITQTNAQPIRFWLTRFCIKDSKFAGHLYVKSF